MADSTITRDHCIGCGHALKDGEAVYEDPNEGLVHAACCDDDPAAFVGSNGEPLKPGDPIPAPFIYQAGEGLLRCAPFRGPPNLGEYRNFYRRPDGSVRIGASWRDATTAATMRELKTGESFITCRNMRFEDVPAYIAALATGGAE